MKRLEGFVPYNRDLKVFSRELRSNMTVAEKRIWQAIRKRSIEFCLFLRQKPVLTYIVDFYCSELLLVIEIDGSSHDQRQELDLNRTLKFQEFGITVIRYTNEQVIRELPRVIIHLRKIIKILKTKNTS